MTQIATIAGVVLSGGRSSRMGGDDKSLLPLGKYTMMQRILARLRPQVGTLAISANGNPSRYGAYGLPVLADQNPDFPGPLAGILAAMQWASDQRHCERVLTVAGDSPFFPEDLGKRLDGSGDVASISVASSAGRLHPVFALWPVTLRDDLKRFLAMAASRSVSAFLATQTVTEVAFPAVSVGSVSLDPFFNINTPADLAEAERIAEAWDA